MAKETKKADENSATLKEILRLERAKCLHLFDCGKVAERDSIKFPSVVFTCKICNGKIQLYAEDFISRMTY